MDKRPKVLFIGVFDSAGRSTNNSQIIALREMGCNVSGYNYREKAIYMGAHARDQHLIDVVITHKFDLVIYSKCNEVSLETFKKINELTTTCLWYMDPLVSYTEEMRTKTTLVDYFCCDKNNVHEAALSLNSNSFHVCEGFDQAVDKPHNIEKQYQVSFIGNTYGDRREILEQLKTPVVILSGVYGTQHAKEVSKTKINLNFCTSNGASDRVYKVLAARGFLLTNDWIGREEMFRNREDLVIFKDIRYLNEKVVHYLKNFDEAQRIAANGYQTVQKYTRLKWAEKIVEIYEQFK